jgi:Flp pilus assembly pilin Flp
MNVPSGETGVAYAGSPPEVGIRKVTRVLQFVQRAFSVSRLRSEDGQTMAEYGVILAVISVSVLGALLAFSGAIQVAFQVVNDTISAVV